MNLHSIAVGAISVVNPLIPVGVQISIGQGAPQPDGTRPPLYAAPGALTAAIGGTFSASSSGTTLTVASVLTGSLWPGDRVFGSDGTNALSAIVESQLSGTAGGAGSYLLSAPAAPGDLGSTTVTSLSSVLNVSAIAQGAPMAGQTLADSGTLLPGTTITGQMSGPTNGIGLYSVNLPQTVASEAMTTTATLQAQIQPMTWRDLQQLDGLHLQGTRQKVYLFGEVDGLVRVENKGGDLITIPPGSRHAGVWLCAQVLEQWPGWVSAAITLQNGA